MTAVTRAPRPWTVLALLLGIVVLAAHGPVLGGRSWSDPRYQTEIVPARIAAVEAIADGRLPGWWERAGLGAPLWAEPAHGATYPGWWPAAVAPAHAPWTLDALAVLHAWWAALGAALLARRLGADDLGALVAGSLFGSSDVVTGAIVAGGIGAVAHLPWAAWAGDRIAGAASTRGRIAGTLALAAIGAAIALAGRPVLAIDAAALALAVVAARAARRGPALVACAGGLALAGALAAIAWLPALFHAGGDVIRPEGATATPWALLELVIPHAARLGDAAAPAAYLGGAALLLAVVAVLGDEPGRRALGAVAAALAVAGAALGPEHLAPAAVLIAGLAGAGFTRLAAQRPDRRTFRAVAVTGGALVSIVAALAAARPALARRLADPAGGLDEAVARVDAVLGHAALAVAVALAAIALLIAASRRPWPVAVPAAGLVALAHAVIVGRLAHPTAPRAAFTEAPAMIAGIDAAGADAEARAALVAAGLSPRLYRPSRMDDAGATPPTFATLGAATPARFGLAAARWPAPGRRTAEDALWTASGTAGGRLFDRYAIDLAIVPASIAVPADLPVLAERGGWALVATRARRPRAFLAPRWRWFEGDAAALAALFPPPGGEGLPLGTVARIGDGEPPPADAVAAPARCDVRADHPERITLHCDGGGGLAVLADAWAPGWTATVDGAARPVERVDLALRGVVVPPGAHDVVLSYTPPGAAAGRWISLAGLALALAAAGLLLRSPR